MLDTKEHAAARPQRPATQRIAVRFPTNLIHLVDAAASRNGMDRSEYIRFVLARSSQTPQGK